MIHILLTTLKVIGILLAITFLLVLTLLLIVLFVPIRYKAKVENLIVTEFAFVLNEEIGKMKEIIISKLQN